MVRDGVCWICACSLILATMNWAVAQPPADVARTVDGALTVQNTLFQARQALTKGAAKQAVTLLEANLHLINGNKDYLAALRDAYWAQLKELQAAQRDNELNEVLKRLRILDPSAELPGHSSSIAIESPKNSVPQLRTPLADDPFQRTPRNLAATSELIQSGRLAFANRQYAEAARFFQQAHAADANSLGDQRASWAYCRLHQVIERINSTASEDSLRTAGLEQEIEQALALAQDKPALTAFAVQVQERLRERLRSGKARAVAPDATEDAGSWHLAESANFRVLHRHSKEFAERILALSEEARAQQFEKWFGPAPASWTPRCDIFVYTTASEYLQATRQSTQSPGHSTVEFNEGTVIRRRLDLVGNHVNLLSATIPHEVTHVVLADLFSKPNLPRWADEAMAILAEPRSQIDRYLRGFTRCKQDGTLFPTGQLVSLTEFPESPRITAFYCQSVALVDMLIREKDARTFALFLRTAQRYGYEKAFERTYGVRNLTELHKKLLAQTN